MRKPIDIAGKKYGRLRVIERGPKLGARTAWWCVCACGAKKLIATGSLRSSNTKSCGCKQGDATNELGNRYGRLLVTARAKSDSPYACWRCLCDCGKKTIVNGNSLRSGNTTSCGCYRDKRAKEIASLPYGIGARNRATAVMKANAKIRGIKWELPDKVLYALIKKDCHYCGASPSQKATGRNGDFLYNGLDRVDNRGCYESGNVVPCCFVCNNAKRTLSLEAFLAWAEKLYFKSISGSR